MEPFTWLVLLYYYYDGTSCNASFTYSKDGTFCRILARMNVDRCDIMLGRQHIKYIPKRAAGTFWCPIIEYSVTL